MTTQKNIGDLHFLVADDQTFIRSLVQGMLARLGVRHLTLASSGEEAL